MENIKQTFHSNFVVAAKATFDRLFSVYFVYPNSWVKVSKSIFNFCKVAGFAKACGFKLPFVYFFSKRKILKLNISAKVKNNFVVKKCAVCGHIPSSRWKVYNLRADVGAYYHRTKQQLFLFLTPGLRHTISIRHIGETAMSNCLLFWQRVLLNEI